MATNKTTKEVEVKISATGAAAAQRSLSGLGQTLKDLNNAAKGAGLSGDAGLVSLLKGAGALAGVKLAAEALKDGTEAFKEFRQGALTAGEAWVKFARSIPIVGSALEIGASLRELWEMTVNEGQYRGELKAADLYSHADRVRATEDAAAAGYLKKGRGLAESRGDPLYRKRKELEEDMARIWEKLHSNMTVLSEKARDDYEESFKTIMIERHRTMEDIERREGSFMRGIRGRISNLFGYGGQEIWFDFKKRARAGVEAYNARQNEIDLESWRGAAEARKAAEEMFMSDTQLDIQRRREEFLRVAADDRVPEELRRKAMQGARNLGGIYVSGGYSPSISAGSLTGAHVASGEGRAGDEAKTAKNTEKTASATTEALTHLKTIADKLTSNPRLIIGIGL